MDELGVIYNYQYLDEMTATAGQPLEAELELVARQGFQLVINLALEDAEYSLENERRLVESLGMQYAHRPVIWTAPCSEDLDWFLDIMQQCSNKKKFIHCAANMRVSCFMALYRIIQHGLEYPQAMEDIHHIWQPDETWQQFMETELQKRRAAF